MRVKNSLKNMISGLLSNTVSIIIGLISQAFFLKILNSEYLGLNGLFTNIISMLSIAELGIGNAIIYHLYKPIADDDKEKIASLMQFYKKSYRCICIIILIIGLLIIPILPLIINMDNITLNVNVYYIYLLFLLDTVFSYFMSYKRGLLFANQKNYIINLIHIGYTITLNFFQILVLYFTHNYYLYLIIRIIMRILENLIITIYVNHKFPFINIKSRLLDKNLKHDIFLKIKGLMFHKIAGFIVSGTDNIIISKFLGLSIVGLYSNYYLIISSVQGILGQIISATTASVGDYAVNQKNNKQFLIFNRIRFINYWLSVFSSVSIFVIMNSFIENWLGKQYILSNFVLLVLVINYYFNSSRFTYNVYKEANGICYEDRYVPIIESVINIIASIILVKYFGLAGIFLGTITSSMIIWLYSYPIFIYKLLFNKSYKMYIKEIIRFFLQFIIILIITFYSSLILKFDNSLLELLKNIIICILVPNTILLLIYFKTNELKYYLGLLKKIKQNYLFNKRSYRKGGKK